MKEEKIIVFYDDYISEHKWKSDLGYDVMKVSDVKRLLAALDIQSKHFLDTKTHNKLMRYALGYDRSDNNQSDKQSSEG